MTKTTLTTALALTIAFCSNARVDAQVVSVNILRFDVRRLGDVDGDGVVTLRDANAISRYLSDGVPLGTFPAVADVNKDGKVGRGDVLLISQYCAGYDVGLSARDYVTAGISDREARQVAYDATAFGGAVQVTQTGPSEVRVKIHDLFSDGPPPPNARLHSPYGSSDAHLVRCDYTVWRDNLGIQVVVYVVLHPETGTASLAKVVGDPDVTVTIETPTAQTAIEANRWSITFPDILETQWD